MKVLVPPHAILAMVGISSCPFSTHDIAGNFVEEPEPEMKELDTGSGYHEGMTSAWSIAGWVAVSTCMIVLICVVGYFKKAIE